MIKRINDNVWKKSVYVEDNHVFTTQKNWSTCYCYTYRLGLKTIYLL